MMGKLVNKFERKKSTIKIMLCYSLFVKVIFLSSRRRILPVAFFGMLLTKMTPPRSFLTELTWSVNGKL